MAFPFSDRSENQTDADDLNTPIVDDSQFVEESEDSAIEQLSAQLAEREAQLLQMAADFENYKRLATRRESEVRERSVRTILEDLLPVVDNFERAVQMAQTARDVEPLRIGIEFILQQLQQSLRDMGVEILEATGQQFDPLQHEALEEVPDDDVPPGTVLEEVQRGYVFKGQVLRPARVRVAG